MEKKNYFERCKTDHEFNKRYGVGRQGELCAIEIDFWESDLFDKFNNGIGEARAFLTETERPPSGNKWPLIYGRFTVNISANGHHMESVHPLKLETIFTRGELRNSDPCSVLNDRGTSNRVQKYLMSIRKPETRPIDIVTVLAWLMVCNTDLLEGRDEDDYIDEFCQDMKLKDARESYRQCKENKLLLHSLMTGAEVEELKNLVRGY